MIKRLTSPTPSFWKKVQKFGAILAIGGTSFVAMCKTYSLAPNFSQYGIYAIIVGTVLAAMAQAAKEGE